MTGGYLTMEHFSISNASKGNGALFGLIVFVTMSVDLFTIMRLIMKQEIPISSGNNCDLNYLSFFDNDAGTWTAGAIRAETNSDISISNCTFSQNHAGNHSSANFNNSFYKCFWNYRKFNGLGQYK